MPGRLPAPGAWATGSSMSTGSQTGAIPGSRTGYSGAGAVGGLLVGKRFGIGGVWFRVEADAMFGDLSAGTNGLDPGCTDEAAASRFRWIATVRVGVEETIGDVGVFVSGGPALARIVNSVTIPTTAGVHVWKRICALTPTIRSAAVRRKSDGRSAPVSSCAGRSRFDGSYLDFGSETYRVNLSGNNSCGPGGAMRPCRYTVRNRLGVVRWGSSIGSANRVCWRGRMQHRAGRANLLGSSKWYSDDKRSQRGSQY